MRTSQGFTLIELVICIVILGVLTVTAYPRMVGLQQDARVAVLKGAREALRTANDQLYIKAVLQQVENEDSNVKNIDIDGDGRNDIAGYFGLIKFVTDAETLAGFDPKLRISRWYGVDSPDEPYYLISFTDRPPNRSSLCYIEVYYPHLAGESVTYDIQTSGC